MIFFGLFFVLYYLFNLMFSSFNPFTPLFGALSSVGIINEIYYWKEYYNKTIYLILITLVCAGILILSYIYTSTSVLSTYFLISVAMVIILIVLSVYESNKRLKMFYSVKGFNEHLNKYPKDFEVLKNKGDAFFKLKEYKKAI